MNKQPALIHQQNTWLHFIGGYYKDMDKFINESIKSRISRRAPAHVEFAGCSSEIGLFF